MIDSRFNNVPRVEAAMSVLEQQVGFLEILAAARIGQGNATTEVMEEIAQNIACLKEGIAQLQDRLDELRPPSPAPAAPEPAPAPAARAQQTHETHYGDWGKPRLVVYTEHDDD